MASFLIVDDDPFFCRQLESHLRKLGHACTCSATLQQGLAHGSEQNFDVVFLDVHLPDSSGLHGIEHFRSADSSPEVIIITGDSDPDGAELAIRNGAWYYVEKPLGFHSVRLLADRVLQYRDTSFKAQHTAFFRREGIIGEDPKLEQCLNQLSLAARGVGSVLITGETGTGKDLFARALHHNSPRTNKPLVFLDCSRLSASTASQLLYGAEDDDLADPGVLSRAEGGTLVLNEIGDLHADMQRLVLRIVQDNGPQLSPHGDERPPKCRFLATTNRDIESMAARGAFRNDLFYRLASFHIHIPPLRERREDIRLLMRHFVDQACQQNSVHPKGVSTEFIEALLQHSWPGNVHELINVARVAVATAGEEPVLYPYHLPLNIKAEFFRKAGGAALHRQSKADLDPSNVPEGFEDGLPTLKQFREEAYAALEAEYLDRLITVSEADVQRACKLADISRSRLYQLLAKHERQMKP